MVGFTLWDLTIRREWKIQDWLGMLGKITLGYLRWPYVGLDLARVYMFVLNRRRFEIDTFFPCICSCFQKKKRKLSLFIFFLNEVSTVFNSLTERCCDKVLVSLHLAENSMLITRVCVMNEPARKLRGQKVTGRSDMPGGRPGGTEHSN